MSDFQNTATVRSMKQRRCPECLAGIGIGQTYRRETGRYDGAFYSAIMCLPCGVFMDRYVRSMQQCTFLNSDEVCFTFGEIIAEAAEYVGYEAPHDGPLPRPRKREGIHALFDDFDASEREFRRQEIAQRREAVARQARFAADAALRIPGVISGASAPAEGAAR